MDSLTEMLKTLTEAHGVPGYESPVRAVVRKYLEPLGTLSQDGVGSLISCKRGSAPAPKIMLAGHMDEIGFMVKSITKEGFIRFLPLGGWFDQVLLGQRVVIQTRKGEIVGVIGCLPPHLIPAEERNKLITKREMYIDIGATSLGEVEESGVRIGDAIVPRADFVELFNGKTYLAKAFDNRVGVALIISALQALQNQEHPNSVYGVATVMEEVGVRGATTSVDAVKPDVAIVLEVDIARDVPGIKPEDLGIVLGKGPSIVHYDARMIPNLKLRDLLMDTAAEIGVPVQASTLEGGATDGSAIHLYKTGVPTVVLSIPARHIHSHSSIIHRDDYDGAVRVLVEILKRLDAATVAELIR